MKVLFWGFKYTFGMSALRFIEVSDVSAHGTDLGLG